MGRYLITYEKERFFGRHMGKKICIVFVYMFFPMNSLLIFLKHENEGEGEIKRDRERKRKFVRKREKKGDREREIWVGI